MSAAVSELLETILEHEERHSSAGRKGRPPIASLEEFSRTLRPDEDPIIDLIAVVVAADLQLAVLGVRCEVPSKDNDKANRIVKVVETAIDNAAAPAQWTTFAFDQRQRFLFNKLRWIHEDVVRAGATYDARRSTVALDEGFSSGWSFHVFCAGKRSISQRVITRLFPGQGAKVHHWKCESFFQQLEGLVYQLRVTCNLHGLCLAWGHVPSLSAGAEIGCEHVEWHVTPNQIRSQVRRRLAASALLAHRGYVLALRWRLFRGVANCERLSIKVPAPRSRVSMRNCEGKDGMDELIYLFLPELGYRLDVNAGATADLTQALRDPRRAPRFEYAVRLNLRQPTTSFPRAILRGEFSGEPTESVPVGLISLPRQFLMPAPPGELTGLARLARARVPAQRILLDRGDGESPAFLFSCPKLLHAIEQAFRRNDYGEAVAVLRSWRANLIARYWEGEDSPPYGWQWDLICELPDILPPFHFTDEELAAPEISPHTRSKMLASPLPGFPGYDRNATLRKLYTELDADFLLRHLDEDDWIELKNAEEQFCELCREEIAAVFWPKAKPLLSNFRDCVPFDVRDLAWRYEDDLPPWGAEALQLFRPFPRVLRHAVETAQRFVLEGRTPVAAAICTQQELIRSWKSYLGQFLKPRLLDRVKSDKKSEPYDERKRLKRQFGSQAEDWQKQREQNC